MINEKLLTTLLDLDLVPKEYKVSETFPKLLENDLAKITSNIIEFDSKTRRFKLNNHDYDEIAKKGDLFNVFENIGKSGVPVQDKIAQGRLKWFVTDNFNDIMKIFKEIYEIQIDSYEDFVNKEEQIIQALWNKYQPIFNLKESGKNPDNIAFSVVKFKDYDGIERHVLMVSINGKQFMPGTYKTFKL